MCQSGAIDMPLSSHQELAQASVWRNGMLLSPQHELAHAAVHQPAACYILQAAGCILQAI